MKTLVQILLLAATASFAFAGGTSVRVPEIDGATAVSAIALAVGSFTILRSRRRR